jgi:hypothetical protein
MVSCCYPDLKAHILQTSKEFQAIYHKTFIENNDRNSVISEERLELPNTAKRGRSRSPRRVSTLDKTNRPRRSVSRTRA